MEPGEKVVLLGLVLPCYVLTKGGCTVLPLQALNMVLLQVRMVQEFVGVVPGSSSSN